MLNIAQFDSMSPHHTFSGPPTASENVTVGASSVQSSVLLTGTRLVRLHAVVACRVAFGLNPPSLSGCEWFLSAAQMTVEPIGRDVQAVLGKRCFSLQTQSASV